MIIFIGCGKRKNSYKCPAKMMYQGNFFKTCLSYAKTLTVENNIYIICKIWCIKSYRYH
jgi:hypothetical protein